MSYIERIQLPFQSFFDIIIDSIGGSKVVISPRLNAFHVATSDDDAISYALNLSNQLANASIYHIVLFKVPLSPVNTYSFNATYALLIGNIPLNVVNYSNGLMIVQNKINTSLTQNIQVLQSRNPVGNIPSLINYTLQNYFKGNNVAVAAAATSLAVTLPVTLPSTNYAVYVTPQWNTSYWITGKTTTGFTINFGTAAPTGGSALDWVIFF